MEYLTLAQVPGPDPSRMEGARGTGARASGARRRGGLRTEPRHATLGAWPLSGVRTRPVPDHTVAAATVTRGVASVVRGKVKNAQQLG